MDLRDAIALPATLAFIAGGFYWIVADRLRSIRSRLRSEAPRARPSRWQRLSPAQRVLRRTLGIVLGIAVAVVLQVIGREIIDAVYR
jgi:hypothetical protein